MPSKGQVDLSAIHEAKPSLLPNVWPEYIAFQSTLNTCVKHVECVQLEAALSAIMTVSVHAISCFQRDRLAAFQLGWLEHAVKSGNTSNVRDVMIIIKQFRVRVTGTDLYVFAEEGFSACFTNDLSLFSGLMVNREPHSCTSVNPTMKDIYCCLVVSTYSDLIDCAEECLAFLFESIHPCASVAPQTSSAKRQRNAASFQYHTSPLFEVFGPAMSNLACRPSQPPLDNPLIDVFKWVPFLWLVRRYGNILMRITPSTGDGIDLFRYVLEHVASLADLGNKRRQKQSGQVVTREVLIQALLASGDLAWHSNFMIDAATTIDDDYLPVLAKIKACLGVQVSPPSHKASANNSSNESMSSSSSSYSSSSPSTSSLQSSVGSNDSNMP
jgi:hypothetical protein